MNLKQLVNESEGPMNIPSSRGKALFDVNEEVSLNGISDKLIQAANVIVDHRIAIATGLEPNTNSIFYNSPESEWILSQVEPMLKALQQTKKIKAENMKDVTNLLGKGKVSLPEAKELISLISKKSSMELLKELE